MLYGHPKVLSEPMWVRFLGFGDCSITVGIFAYIGVNDSAESLEIAEDLNLRIMDIVAAAGTDFALPAAPRKPFDETRVRPSRLRSRNGRPVGRCTSRTSRKRRLPR